MSRQHIPALAALSAMVVVMPVMIANPPMPNLARVTILLTWYVAAAVVLVTIRRDTKEKP